MSALAVAAIGFIQLLFEGYRWQLVPGYLLAALLAVFAFTRVRPIVRPAWRIAGWAGGAAIAVLLPFLVPIPRLPVPDGPYAVGTTTVVLADASRIETYGLPASDAPRLLPLHIWYPAAASDEVAPGWLTPATAAAVSAQYGLPGFFLDHLGLTATHAAVDVPVAPGTDRFPVVVYSHGWTGFGRISPDQPERLASHGFVVVAPDHTYGALVSDIPGGLVPYDPEALPDEEEVSENDYAAASQKLVATFAGDIRFVFGSLATLDPSGLGLGGRLDLERIGVYGHSTGGGAAVAACHEDDRCDAVLGFDPWVEPVGAEVIADGLTQPFLALRSNEWVVGPNDEVLTALHGAGAAPSELLALVGADHSDFVSLSQISPLAGALGFKGPIPGDRAQEIIGSELVWFFDRYLRDIDREPPEFPELRVDIERD